MQKIIRSITGTFAGIFIMLAVFQAFMAIPEFNQMVSNLLRGLITGLIIGAIITGIIGIAFLYLSIKGKF